MAKFMDCDECGGNGWISDWHAGEYYGSYKCHKCDGTGVLTTCFYCHGTGSYLDYDGAEPVGYIKCPYCSGKAGTVR